MKTKEKSRIPDLTVEEKEEERKEEELKTEVKNMTSREIIEALENAASYREYCIEESIYSETTEEREVHTAKGYEVKKRVTALKMEIMYRLQV